MMAPPRHSGERTKCGRRRRRRVAVSLDDRGHDFVLDRRAALAGGDGRAALAGYPLGILYARGLIFYGDHAAGLKYATLSSTVWGGRRNALSYLAKTLPSRRTADDPVAETDPVKIEASMHRACAQLQEAVDALRALPSSRPFHVLENTVVYEQPMRFMDSARRRSPAAWRADQADIEALQLALGTLAELWDIERAA